jgi:DNA invertase Pin-like site-specific DNA recombinase
MIPDSGKAVAYFRVSTDKQASLGYSLEAQQTLVRDFIEERHLQLVAEHTETESGFGPASLAKRPSLRRALQDCRRHKARLVIASLDRLARNVVFIATLVETRIEFVALDIPDATPFMIHIYAAVAEEESRKRGEIVRVAMAIAKARGKVWGQRGRRLAEASRLRAESFRPLIEEIRAAGTQRAHAIARELTRRGIPNTLNQRGLPNLLGAPWCAGVVKRILQVLGYDEPTPGPWWQYNSIKSEERVAILRPIFVEILSAAPCTARECAQRLNERGIPSARGKPWNAGNVQDFKKRHFRTLLRPSSLESSGMKLPRKPV